ncbi:MAG: sigma-54 dependent transcriptional regulator [Acidobacteriota bacterium]
MPKILVVDDEPNITEILEIAFQDDGMDVFKSGSGKDALKILRKQEIDVVVSDIMMPDLSGVDLLSEAKQFAPNTPFIMITAFASTETAIEALQHGAYDYVTKPFGMEELRSIVHQALETRNTRKVKPAITPDETVYRTIGTVAMGDSTTRITGESGTGQALVARAVHEASHRREKPFVSINCSAFPETLLESELFGYMKGAFTGATTNKKGLFEAAGGGSIFLDEIGDMTPAMQVKLLRVLQERSFRPLGGNEEISVDVRVIAATNQDLQTRIADCLFREDLYYRIAVINIHMPALRERAEDIRLLAFYFLRHYAEKAGKSISGISPEALQILESYDWPGNVRQLENTIERAVALETTQAIQPERLPDTVHKRTSPLEREIFSLPEGPFDLENFLSEVETSLIGQALQQSDGNQTLTARRLMLTKGSLRHKIQSLQIKT